MFATKFKLNQKFDVNNYLIMVDSFKGANIYKKILNSWDDNPFYKIFVLPLDKYDYRIFNYIEQRRINEIIKKITKKIIPDTVCIFNDMASYSQSILQIQMKLNCGKAIYIEDGLAPYCEISIKHTPELKKLFQRYIYLGNRYLYLPFQGSHPQITEMYVNYPELIDKKKYSHLKINKIDSNLYKIFEKSKFTEKLLSFTEYDINKLKKIQYILILPHSSTLKKNNRVFILYEELFKKFIEKKYNFAIKYHPRDYDKKYMQIEDKSFFEIPSYLPVEIIYITLRNINKEISIIGDSSTSILITPGVLLPNAKVYSLIKMVDYKYEEIIEKFKERVIMIKSLTEIEGL